jgi:hypothetical protein
VLLSEGSHADAGVGSILARTGHANVVDAMFQCEAVFTWMTGRGWFAVIESRHFVETEKRPRLGEKQPRVVLNADDLCVCVCVSGLERFISKRNSSLHELVAPNEADLVVNWLSLRYCEYVIARELTDYNQTSCPSCSECYLIRLRRILSFFSSSFHLNVAKNHFVGHDRSKLKLRASGCLQRSMTKLGWSPSSSFSYVINAQCNWP